MTYNGFDAEGNLISKNATSQSTELPITHTQQAQAGAPTKSDITADHNKNDNKNNNTNKNEIQDDIVDVFGEGISSSNTVTIKTDPSGKKISQPSLKRHEDLMRRRFLPWKLTPNTVNEHRTKVMDTVVSLLITHHNHISSKKSIDKATKRLVNSAAQKIELDLFGRAETMIEFSDITSLPQRISRYDALGDRIKRKRSTEGSDTEERPVNTSSLTDTHVPQGIPVTTPKGQSTSTSTYTSTNTSPSSTTAAAHLTVDITATRSYKRKAPPSTSSPPSPSSPSSPSSFPSFPSSSYARKSRKSPSSFSSSFSPSSSHHSHFYDHPTLHDECDLVPPIPSTSTTSNTSKSSLLPSSTSSSSVDCASLPALPSLPPLPPFAISPPPLPPHLPPPPPPSSSSSTSLSSSSSSLPPPITSDHPASSLLSSFDSPAFLANIPHPTVFLPPYDGPVVLADPLSGEPYQVPYVMQLLYSYLI